MANGEDWKMGTFLFFLFIYEYKMKIKNRNVPSRELE